MKENNKDKNIKDIINVKNDAIKDKNNDYTNDDFLEELFDDIFMQFFHIDEEEKYSNN